MKVIDSTNLGYLWGKINAAFFSKDDSVTIGIDSAPTQNSSNLVESGGVYTAVSAKYTKPTNGIPASDLAQGVIPDVSGKENTSNKVTSLSSASTDTQYPSAKCVYDLLGDVETLINAL